MFMNDIDFTWTWKHSAVLITGIVCFFTGLFIPFIIIFVILAFIFG